MTCSMAASCSGRSSLHPNASRAASCKASVCSDIEATSYPIRGSVCRRLPQSLLKVSEAEHRIWCSASDTLAGVGACLGPVPDDVFRRPSKGSMPTWTGAGRKPLSRTGLTCDRGNHSDEVDPEQREQPGREAVVPERAEGVVHEVPLEEPDGDVGADA